MSQRANLSYVQKIIMYSFLGFWSVLAIFPLIFTLFNSFKDNIAIFRTPFAAPVRLSLSNYVRAWELANVGVFFVNSVVYTVAVVLVLALIGSMMAYVLSRFSFPGKKIIFTLVLSGMMIPVQSTIIPIAFNIAQFGWRDNYLMLVLVTVAFSISVTVFIISGFMKSIPRELEESAVLDGASSLRVFFTIIIPMSTPAIATASTFNFLSTWNNLLFPLIFIGRTDRMPLSYGLLSFFGQFRAEYGPVMAAIIITVIPPMLVYAFLQQKVESGLTAGAIKG